MAGKSEKADGPEGGSRVSQGMVVAMLCSVRGI